MNLLFIVPEYAVVTGKPSKQRRGAGGEGGWWTRRGRSRGRDEDGERSRGQAEDGRRSGGQEEDRGRSRGRDEDGASPSRRQSQTSDLYEILSAPTAYNKGKQLVCENWPLFSSKRD